MMFKNKKLVVTVAVVLVLALLGGGYYFFTKSKSSTQEDQSKDEIIQKLSSEEIGLTMEASPDNKKVKFAIGKLSGITGVEYELTYEADSTAQDRSQGGEDRVQRGITGESELDSGESNYESPWLDLGSCSKNVCRYDTGVSSLILTLKVVKNGKTYSVEKTLEL